MARPKIDEFWVKRIKAILANDPDMPGAAIRRKLINDQKSRNGDAAPTQAPSDRAIRRIKKEVPQEELKRFKHFVWPEAMQTGALPWEASRACLDLLAYQRKYLPNRDPKPEGFEDRPTIDFIRLYCAVTQAAPNASIPIRLMMAAGLETNDERRTEACLAYAPWESTAKADAYAEAITSQKIPKFTKTKSSNPPYADPRMARLFEMFGTLDIEDLMKDWEWLFELCSRWKARPLPNTNHESKSGPQQITKKGTSNGKTKTNRK